MREREKARADKEIWEREIKGEKELGCRKVLSLHVSLILEPVTSLDAIR